jgi:protein-disulfide isomerase
MQAMTQEANQYAQTFYEDVDLQRYLHLRQPARPVPLRPDDPVRGNLTAPHTVVVFSDFQCPGCRSFAEFSERELLPRFGNQLRIVYKHFPLAPECNPGITRTVHPQACEAAFAAEAARELGGAAAFWKMHDVLFQQQTALGQIPWADLGRQAGLDGAAIADRVSRRVALNRILQDAQAGHAAHIDHTPTIILDGRPLDNWSRIEVWQGVLEAVPAPTAPLPPAGG